MSVFSSDFVIVQSADIYHGTTILIIVYVYARETVSDSLITAWMPILALLTGALTVPAFYVTALSNTKSLKNLSFSSIR